MDSYLVQNIHHMQKDLQAHHRKKDALIAFYVQKRLTKSVESYYADLMKAQAAIEQRDARKVFKELMREDKNAQYH